MLATMTAWRMPPHSPTGVTSADTNSNPNGKQPPNAASKAKSTTCSRALFLNSLVASASDSCSTYCSTQVPMSCCWMSPITIWIFRRASGSKNNFVPVNPQSSWLATTAHSWSAAQIRSSPSKDPAAGCTAGHLPLFPKRERNARSCWATT